MERFLKVNFPDNFLHDLDVEILQQWLVNNGWIVSHRHNDGDGYTYVIANISGAKTFIYSVMTSSEKLQCLIDHATYTNSNILSILSAFGWSWENNCKVDKFDNMVALLKQWIYELGPIETLSDEFNMSSIATIKQDFEMLVKKTQNFLTDLKVNLENT